MEQNQIYTLQKEELSQLNELYASFEKTMVWSCLQGYMGTAYGIKDKSNQYISAMLEVGDFSFLAGLPDERFINLLLNRTEQKFFLVMAQTEGWNQMIEAVYGDTLLKISRYAIKKEPDVFDKDRLLAYKEAVSDEYELHDIDQKLYMEILGQEWSKDLCSVFTDYEAYKKNGIGTAALYKGEIVAGASSYTVYNGGIEIEIDTKESYRRKGLALACGAALILNCLERGLYPSWDAHDMRSVKVAEKLGYHLEREYTAYEYVKQ